MTTTARRQPVQEQKPHSEFKHGPVAAAFNASVGTLFLTTIGKLAGLPPWIALVAGVVMAGCLVQAGRHRTPRPLSRKSLVYRATAMLTAGVWMWVQLATFPPVGINTTQVTTLLVAWPVTILLIALAAATTRVPAAIRLLVSAAVFVFTVALTAVLGGPVLAWLHTVLTVTDPLGRSFDVLGPWLGYSALTVAMVAAPMAVLGVAFANRELTADEELAAAEQRDAAPTPPEGRVMQRLVCTLANEWTEIHATNLYESGRKVPNLRVTDVRFWKNGAGETYVFDLTGNLRGTTLEKMRTFGNDIATKLNLPQGCGVEVLGAGEEEGRGFAHLKIARKNVLKDILPYPELMPRSILNAMPLGKTRDGVVIGPFFRESSAFLWGQKGCGKTGVIFTIVAGGLQCTNALVWGIDLNGGAAFAPFLSGWYEGKVDRPCVDWVATTIEEVVEMAEVGLDIALDRKKFYRKLKKQHNTNLMPIGNGGPGEPPPEILIIIDEGATVLGIGGGQMTDEGKAARNALNQIMDLARDAAVNIVFSGLRATADVADTAFKAGTSIRIGMRVTDAPELAYGFGDYSLNTAETPYPGTGFISCGHDEADIQVFKGFYLDPDRNEEIGIITTPWRPYLDERGLQVGGRRYANRWRRTAHLIWDDPRPEMVEYGTVPATVGQREAAATAGGTTTAVMERPTAAAGSIESVSHRDRDAPVVDYTAGSSIPSGAGWEGIMESAKKARRRPEDPGEPPAGPPVPPAATGGPAPEPAPVAPDVPVRDGEEEAQAAVDAKFRDLVTNASVLPEDPRRWSDVVPLPPDGEIAAAHPNSRDILERLVKLHGPIGWKDLHAMFRRGGDWGPGVDISEQAMSKLLKRQGSRKDPVEWLVDRTPGQPYDHRERGK